MGTVKIGALPLAVVRFLDETSHSIRTAILHHFFSITLCDNSSESFFLPHLNTFLLPLNLTKMFCAQNLTAILSSYAMPFVKGSIYFTIRGYWSQQSTKIKDKTNWMFFFFIFIWYFYTCGRIMTEILLFLWNLFMTFLSTSAQK